MFVIETPRFRGLTPKKRRLKNELDAVVQNLSTEEGVEDWLYQDPTTSVSSKKAEDDDDEIPTVPDYTDENRIHDWLYNEGAGGGKTRGDRKRVSFTPNPQDSTNNKTTKIHNQKCYFSFVPFA